MKLKLIIAAAAVVFAGAVLMTASRWQGTDDTVTGQLASRAGVQQTQILPWKLQGDLLLFVFCAGGAVAGFTLGYYWRALFGDAAAGRPGAAGGPARDGGAGNAAAAPPQDGEALLVSGNAAATPSRPAKASFAPGKTGKASPENGRGGATS